MNLPDFKKNNPFVLPLARSILLFLIAGFATWQAGAQCTFYKAYTSTPHIGFSFTRGGTDFSSCTPIGQSFFTTAGPLSTVTIYFRQTVEDQPGFRVWGLNNHDSIEVWVNGINYPLSSSSATAISMFTCGTSTNSNVADFSNGYLVGTDTSANESRAYADVVLNTTGVSEITLLSHAVSGWGFAGALGSCTVVPVTLVSFTATQKGNAIELQWRTAAEINSDHFEIEYSSNGSRWQSIGYKKAAGNSNTMLQYSWQHRQPVTGHHYYRIKQVDTDGKYTYSQVHAVEIKDRDCTVTPNPFHSNFLISGSGITSVVILNATGNRMLTKQNLMGNTCTIDMHQYPGGVYFARLMHADGTTTTRKLLKY